MDEKEAKTIALREFRMQFERFLTAMKEVSRALDGRTMQAARAMPWR